MSELPDKELLRVDEVAEYFCLHRNTIYRWLSTGKLESRKLSRKTLRITRISVLSVEITGDDEIVSQ